MKYQFGLKRVDNPSPTPTVSSGPTIYGGNTPGYVQPQIAAQVMPQYPPVAHYYPMPQPQCCPRPNPCLRELDECGLNGTNSGTYDPEGVTDGFSKDVETYEIPVFGKGENGDGMVWTPGINPNGGKGTTSKVIQIVDIEGNPLENAHVKWSGGGIITNQNGEATVSAASSSTTITITHVGKRTHVAKFGDLGGLITLQENVNGLPPVVVGQPPKQTTTTTPDAPAKKSNLGRNIAIGVGLIFLVSALASKGKTGKAGKAVGLAGTKSKKRKNKKAKGKKRNGLREPAEVTL